MLLLKKVAKTQAPPRLMHAACAQTCNGLDSTCYSCYRLMMHMIIIMRLITKQAGGPRGPQRPHPQPKININCSIIIIIDTVVCLYKPKLLLLFILMHKITKIGNLPFSTYWVWKNFIVGDQFSTKQLPPIPILILLMVEHYIKPTQNPNSNNNYTPNPVICHFLQTEYEKIV